jgi:hypothetical protein
MQEQVGYPGGDAWSDTWKVAVRKSAVWLVAATILVVAVIFVVRRGQDQNWDLLSYHYYSGYAFVHGRFLEDIAPITWHTYLNPLPNVVAFLSYSHLPFPFSGLTLLALQCLSVLALVLLAREVGLGLGHPTPTLTEVLAVVLTATAPLWWSELGTSFYSSTTAPLILFALVLLIRGVTRAGSLRGALMQTAAAGVLVGLASSMKMTNAFFAVAGMAAIAPVLVTHGSANFARRAIAYVCGAVAGLALLGWWNLELFREFGSPVYPLYNAIFRSKYYEFVNWHDPRFAFGLVDFVRFPLVAAAGTTATSELPFADARYVLCAGVAVLAVIRRAIGIRANTTAPGPAGPMLLCFVASALCVWALVFPYQRYLIPVELLLGLALWILLAYCGFRERVMIALLAAFVTVSLVSLRVPDWGHVVPRRSADNVFGLQLPPELVSQPAEYLVAGAPNGFVLAFLNPASHYYRIDFSKKVYDRIRQRVARYPRHPVRLLAMANTAMPLKDVRLLGFEPTAACTRFRSNVGEYVSCELRPIE